MPPGQRIILVAAGAGAGIAATFNTPIGGVMFAIELMMPEVSVRTFLPVALATGTATFIGRFFFGSQPAFAVPQLTPISADATSAIALLLICVAWGCHRGRSRGIRARLAFNRGPFRQDQGSLCPARTGHVAGRHPDLRPSAGDLATTMSKVSVTRRFRRFCSANCPRQDCLLLLFFCKLLATSLSLGSGSSGGIFSPSLFMGATIGGAFAMLLSAFHLPFAINVPSFAMVGMGAMVGGGTGAVMTAVAMIFEMTRDYDIVLPMILAVALSVGVRRLLSP